jgi:hypothetical protein
MRGFGGPRRFSTVFPNPPCTVIWSWPGRSAPSSGVISPRPGPTPAEATEIGLRHEESAVVALGKNLEGRALVLMAEGEEILMSSATAEAAGDAFAYSESRVVSLKGLSEPYEVLAVQWR